MDVTKPYEFIGFGGRCSADFRPNPDSRTLGIDGARLAAPVVPKMALRGVLYTI